MDTISSCQEDGNIPLKRCSRCPEDNQWHPATSEYFHQSKTTKDGLKAWCKRCQAEYNRKYHAEHREQVSQQRKIYYQEHSEHLRNYSAQYRTNNSEKVKQYSVEYNRSDKRKAVKRRYNSAHQEKITAYNMKYRAENREELRQYSARYNAEHHAERLAYGKLRREEHREELNARHRAYRRTHRGRMMHRVHQSTRRARKLENLGTYTAEDLQWQHKNQRGRCYYCKIKLGKKYHADHVIPLSRGGSNDISNIVVTCVTCNLRKSNKLPHEWGEGGRLL